MKTSNCLVFSKTSGCSSAPTSSIQPVQPVQPKIDIISNEKLTIRPTPLV